jgi:kinesin family member 2/24
MSSNRRLVRVGTQTPRDKCLSPLSLVSKEKLTFQELQVTHGSDLRQRSPKVRTPTTTNSPMAIRIRDQILQRDYQAKPTASSRDGTTGMSGSALAGRHHRVKRLENKSPISMTSPSSLVANNLKTPVVRATNARLFTPSPTMRTQSSITPTSTTSSRCAFETVYAEHSFTKTNPSARPPNVSSWSETSLPVPDTNKKKVKNLTPPLVPISSGKISTPQLVSASTGRSTGKQTKGTLTPKSSQRTPLRALSNTPPSDEDDTSTRRNLDKRSARLRFSGEFSRQIDKYKQSPSLVCSRPVSFNKAAHTHSSVQVYVRKRPLFQHETARGDFDVVAIDSDASTPSVIVYRTQMAPDMKTKLIQPISFPGITAAFDSDVDSHEVYDKTVAPLVETVMKSPTAATLLLFGQTGSGKTFTMSACQDRVARQLFEAYRRHFTVHIQVIELAGKNCRDLLGDYSFSGECCNTVKILDHDDGSVRFVNAASVTVASAEALNQLLANVKERRSTQSTSQNDESSRSHAIYHIRLVHSSSSKASVLTLVDCAGTERRNDRIYHCRERQSESAEINSSLYALKECIRQRGLGSNYIPYRQHLLTRILRECLESTEAPLAVIATVAPNATDTEHTMETLKTVCTLTSTTYSSGDLQPVEETFMSDLPKPPKQWSHGELLEWMVQKRLFPTKETVASHLDGRTVMRMPKLQLRNAFYEGSDLGKADKLFSLLRAENDRVARLDLKRRFAQSRAAGGVCT